MITFINMTPNNIVETLTQLAIPPSGIVARLDNTTKQIGTLDSIPIYSKEFSEIQNLPDPQENTYFIVSGVMLDVAKQQGRTDCLAPGTPIRDNNGKIIGCKGFVA